jgi:hypothetical protein
MLAGLALFFTFLEPTTALLAPLRGGPYAVPVCWTGEPATSVACLRSFDGRPCSGFTASEICIALGAR